MSKRFRTPGLQLVVTAGLAVVSLVPARGESRTSSVTVDSFDDVAGGRSPARWARVSGTEREWAVLPDLTAPTPPKVLANIWVGAEDGARSILVRTDGAFGHGTIHVRLKPMGGLGRQAAGVVWRYRGPDNHSFARLNFVESTVAICVVAGGVPDCVERTAELDALSWSTLTVNFLGRHVSLTLEGQRLIEIDGRHDAWPGQAGVWSASSSVTFFDEFKAIECDSK